MTTATKTMPTRREFAGAGATLKARGFECIASMMVDDAKKEGVEDFGGLYIRSSDKARFWLNFKTIGKLPE